MKLESQNTAEDGTVLYKNLPSGQYVVEVKGNELYLGCNKQITVLNEEDDDTVTIHIGIKLKLDQDCEFQFLMEDENRKLVDMNFQKLEAKAIYIDIPEDEMEFEEYEFDLIWNPKTEVWAQTLKKGKYLITARAPGFSELNEVVTIESSAMNVIKYIMKSTNEGAVNFAIMAQDVEDEKPIKNGIIELWIENHQ